MNAGVRIEILLFICHVIGSARGVVVEVCLLTIVGHRQQLQNCLVEAVYVDGRSGLVEYF